MSEWHFPESEAEAIDCIAHALAGQYPLEVLGRGSKRAMGGKVEAAAVLSLERMAGILLYEPEELVISARPGTALSDIVAALDEHNQMLGFEPPDFSGLLGTDKEQSIGGIVATNLSGPRRFKAGAARDYVLGFEAVSGRGEKFKSGGRVMKNVSGYDLSKLMTGSWGTLGVMTAVTLKVLPAPETTATLVICGASDTRALELMTRALHCDCEVSGAAHLPHGLGSQQPLTALRLEGPAASVCYRLARLREALDGPLQSHVYERKQSQDLWRALRDGTALEAPGGWTVWKLSLPPQSAVDVVAAIRTQQADCRAYYDWGGGLVWLAAAAAEAEKTRQALSEGHGMILRTPDAVRGVVDMFHPQPAALKALNRRIKDSFDPAHILNPGRMGQMG